MGSAHDDNCWYGQLKRETLSPSEDWTIDKKTGRSNSSPLFEKIVEDVARMIRGDAHQLLAGNAASTARLIVAQLAHVHGLKAIDR